MAIYELDPVDRIAIAAVGEPGQRRFFLQATGSGRTLTLAYEKGQIQALVVRLHQMLEAQQIESPEDAAAEDSSAGPAPGEPEWQIGEMGLGYHEARRMFVLVASQVAAGEAAEPDAPPPAPAPAADDAPSVRFWLSHDQVVAFSQQAQSVLAA